MITFKTPHSYDAISSLIRGICLIAVGFFFTFSTVTAFTDTGYIAVITTPIIFLSMFLGVLLFCFYAIAMPTFGRAVLKSETKEESTGNGWIYLAAMGVDLFHVLITMTLISTAGEIAKQHVNFINGREINATEVTCVKNAMAPYFPSTNSTKNYIFDAVINLLSDSFTSRIKYADTCQSIENQ